MRSKPRRKAAARPVADVSRARVPQAERPRRILPRFAERLTLGNGLSLSPFCLGLVSDWRLLPAAFEMGINFFFLSTDMHWPLYEASRKGLKALLARRKGIRNEVVIAGACYLTQPEFSIMPFQELVASVPGLARLDVLVAGGVHGPDLLPRAAVLRRIAARNSAGAIAASFHDRQTALAAANHHIVDLCYVRYNPVHPGARHDLMPHLGPDHPPLFNFKSMRGFVPHERLRALNIDRSLWYPEASDYFRYALSRPQMAGLLFSVDYRRQLVELDAAMVRGGLTAEEEEHLEELAILTREHSASTA